MREKGYYNSVNEHKSEIVKPNDSQTNYGKWYKVSFYYQF